MPLQGTKQKTRLPGGVADRKTGGRSISKRIPVQKLPGQEELATVSRHRATGGAGKGQHRLNGRLDELPNATLTSSAVEIQAKRLQMNC